MCELFAFKEFSGRLGSSYYGTMTNNVVYSKTLIGCVVGHKVTIYSEYITVYRKWKLSCNIAGVASVQHGW